MRIKPDAILTISLVRRSGSFYLARKKRGLGAGYFNAPGGYVEEGEGVIEAGDRELFDECGLKAIKTEEVGVLFFKFRLEGTIIEVHFLLVDESEGETRETDELELGRWYPMDMDAMPKGQMWDGDQFWLPFFFAGEKFCGFVVCDDKENKRVVEQFVTIMTDSR